MSLYQAVLTIHILAAIIGMGPTFVTLLITRRLMSPDPDTPTTLSMLDRINRFPTIGMPLLLLSGLAMGAINQAIWMENWPKISLLLIVVMVVLGLTMIAPVHKRMQALLDHLTDPASRSQFAALGNRLHTGSILRTVIVGCILLLMILKPF